MRGSARKRTGAAKCEPDMFEADRFRRNGAHKENIVINLAQTMISHI